MNRHASVDFHCDVLWKLLEQGNLSFADDQTGQLDVTFTRLRQSGAIFQAFAIYISEKMEKSMTPILQSIDLFHRKVLVTPGIRFVKTAEDIQRIQTSGEVGAMLSLEGADGLQGNLGMLRILYELGVRAIGLTWNQANWGADGVMEPRQGGLTGKGFAFVEECNRLGILLDVSHLSERSFWDMADRSVKPLIASHSNAKGVCDHPRNLSDDQIRALIDMDGMIGITFVPQFVVRGKSAAVADIIRHIEHVCELGGEKHIMFGSDFDGIDTYVEGLSNPGELSNLHEALLKQYAEDQVASFFHRNANRFLLNNLPS
ncbi:dipeptidase [Paenibacillus mendelii]|uniref:Dipeptidase n=1 Tax=Paenibacillus mendelii TaxID=206163 RepID=A0ABV6JGX3_9BACL|nr:dipeptidase [Paenibacillus mendelii]MCQ6557839.1 dipeptidase [Paenibacillus mendelii]